MDKETETMIEREIEAMLEREMRESAVDKKVHCKDGHITLTGFADTLAEKSAVEELVRRVAGVKSVENCITISTDGSLSDKESEAEIINEFRGHGELTPVSARVHKGEAVLEGRVETLKDKNFAIQQASKAMGVKDVISHIHVDNIHEIDSASINNKIQDKLIRAGLDDCDIRVFVDDGYVNLSGFAETQADIKAAQEIAESTEGVYKVRNTIQVRR